MIFVKFAYRKKTYFATVSSCSMEGRDLWLFVYGNEELGIRGNCGYIPNAKIESVGVSVLNKPSISEETRKIIRAW